MLSGCKGAKDAFTSQALFVSLEHLAAGKAAKADWKPIILNKCSFSLQINGLFHRTIDLAAIVLYSFSFNFKRSFSQITFEMTEQCFSYEGTTFTDSSMIFLSSSSGCACFIMDGRSM